MAIAPDHYSGFDRTALSGFDRTTTGDKATAASWCCMMVSEQALSVAGAKCGSPSSRGATQQALVNEARAAELEREAAKSADDIVFWAGREGANRKAAEAFAAATGRKTLAQTADGAALDASLDYANMSVGEIRGAWAGLSEQAAACHPGPVAHSFAGGAGSDTLWKMSELPTLLRNPSVDKIIIKDATQPWKTTIKYR